MDRNTVDEVQTNEEQVALRKESVDRNRAVQIVIVVVHARRSPQGERG